MQEMVDFGLVKQHPVVLVVIYSRTCGHCHDQLRNVATAEAATRDWVGGQMNADLPAAEKKVGSGVPVTLLFRDGKQVAKQLGSMEGAQAVSRWVKAKLELATEAGEKKARKAKPKPAAIPAKGPTKGTKGSGWGRRTAGRAGR